MLENSRVSLFFLSSTCDDCATTGKAAAASQGKFSLPRLQFSWRDAAVDGRRAQGRVRRRPLQAQMQAFSFIESLSINVVQRTDAQHSHNDGTCGKNQRTTQGENPPTTWRKKSTENRWREPHPFYRSRAGDVSFGPLWRAGCWQGKIPSAGPKQPRIREPSLNTTHANWKKAPTFERELDG